MKFRRVKLPEAFYLLFGYLLMLAGQFLLIPLDPGHLRILLSHRPERCGAYARYQYDLVLAGHAHGGQWKCPFFDLYACSPNQRFSPKYVNGFYRLDNGTMMFVSRGLARENSPFPRFFNHPGVFFVDLVR